MKGRLLAGWSALALVSAGAAHSHGGGLNAEGCHNNRKTGDYHCHRAQPAAPTQAMLPKRPPASPKPSAAQALGGEPSVPGVPTCHVGPRGGTYTITASGRKNYGGC